MQPTVTQLELTQQRRLSVTVEVRYLKAAWLQVPCTSWPPLHHSITSIHPLINHQSIKSSILDSPVSAATLLVARLPCLCCLASQPRGCSRVDRLDRPPQNDRANLRAPPPSHLIHPLNAVVRLSFWHHFVSVWSRWTAISLVLSAGIVSVSLPVEYCYLHRLIAAPSLHGLLHGVLQPDLFPRLTLSPSHASINERALSGAP
jgi:hypothetical protein